MRYYVTLMLTVGVCGCAGRPLRPFEGFMSGPALLRPFQGEMTGSVWAPSSLRPLFRWSPLAGASEYEIEIDDSCSEPRNCDFPYPEIDQRTAQPSFRPSAALAVSMIAPVGRRYFWRVRGCAGDLCGDWSSTRYVDVGRQRQDFNGDGYGDLMVATDGTVEVYFGGSALDTVADWTLSPSDKNERLGGNVIWCGDMNGDGFSEMAVLAYNVSDATSAVWILAGGQTPSQIPLAIVAADDSLSGPTLRYAADVDGDGFADLFMFEATKDGTEETVSVLFGDLSTIAVGARMSLQWSNGALVGGCDLDGDGTDDIVAVGQNRTLVMSGHARGAGGDSFSFQPTGAGAAPPLAYALTCAGDFDGSGRASVVLDQYEQPPENFLIWQPGGACDNQPILKPGVAFPRLPSAAGLLDMNGDGVQDLVFGNPFLNQVLFVSGGGCPTGPYDVVSHAVTGSGNSNTGAVVASPGDMDGDGFDEAAVGNMITGIDSIIRSEVYVFHGGTTPPAAPDLTIKPDGFYSLSID